MAQRTAAGWRPGLSLEPVRAECASFGHRLGPLTFKPSHRLGRALKQKFIKADKMLYHYLVTLTLEINLLANTK